MRRKFRCYSATSKGEDITLGVVSLGGSDVKISQRSRHPNVASRGFGTILVPIVVNQNRHSIVYASPAASRDAALKALDPVELAAFNVGNSAPCDPGSQWVSTKRSEVALDGRGQTFSQLNSALRATEAAPKRVQGHLYVLFEWCHLE